MKKDREIMPVIIFFAKSLVLKQPLEFLNGHGMRPLSGMKLNADGVCVMSGYEELLRDDEFAGDA